MSVPGGRRKLTDPSDMGFGVVVPRVSCSDMCRCKELPDVLFGTSRQVDEEFILTPQLLRLQIN